MLESVAHLDFPHQLRYPGMETHYLVSREDLQTLQMDIRQLQLVQNSHADRLSKIEKRQADDSALKSVWNSPFPGVLAGTPQHGPVQMPTHSLFGDLEDHGEHLLGSLHLGPAEEEPMRRGAASRANSVRFDESALQGSNWGQSSRHSEFASLRSGGGSGGLAMERSSSHKSDGRHSSAGHSVHSHHSVVSCRASSLGVETNFFGGSNRDDDDDDDDDDGDSPADYIEPPPGFVVLGTVPAIVRCWLSTDFAPETLLYADICSGAQRSTVEHSLIRELDLLGSVQRDADGTHRISLPVYLTEAMPRPARTRTTIPSIAANFEVVGTDQGEANGEGRKAKDIRVFLGSDVLRAHSADISFSQNQMSIFSSDHSKFAVPFARPEDDGAFKFLCTASAPPPKPRLNANAPPFVSVERREKSPSQPSTPREEVPQQPPTPPEQVPQQPPTPREQAPRPPTPPEQTAQPPARPNGRREEDAKSQGPLSPRQAPQTLPEPAKPAQGQAERDYGWEMLKTAMQGAQSPESGTANDTTSDAGAAAGDGRRDSATGIWGSWRHGGSAGGKENGQRESGSSKRYQPAGRSRSMKVLRAQKSNNPSAKTGAAFELPQSSRMTAASASAAGGGGDGPGGGGSGGGGNGGGGSGGGGNGSGGGGDNRRKSQPGFVGDKSESTGNQAGTSNGRWESKRRVSAGAGDGVGSGNDAKNQRNQASRPSNPVGGASAFSWMKSTPPKAPLPTASSNE